MTHEDLFDFYQNQLAWIGRRLKPDCLELYKESADTWRHAKEVAFNFYQFCRMHTEDNGIIYSYNFQTNGALPYVEDGNTFPCVGILTYRDIQFPVYLDDNGSQEFLVYEGQTVPVDALGGGYDWYYLLDRILDKIN